MKPKATRVHNLWVLGKVEPFDIPANRWQSIRVGYMSAHALAAPTSLVALVDGIACDHDFLPSHWSNPECDNDGGWHVDGGFLVRPSQPKVHDAMVLCLPTGGTQFSDVSVTPTEPLTGEVSGMFKDQAKFTIDEIGEPWVIYLCTGLCVHRSPSPKAIGDTFRPMWRWWIPKLNWDKVFGAWT